MTEIENLIWEVAHLRERLQNLQYYLLHLLPDYDPDD